MSPGRIRVETYSRSSRRFARRRRNDRLATVAGIAALVAVTAAGVWAVSTSGIRVDLPTWPRSSEPTTPPGVDSAEAREPSVQPTTSVDLTMAAGPARPATITVAAVGDMLFDRRIKTFIRSHGGEAPFSAVAERLSAADVTVGNLESMLGETGAPVKNKEYTFRGHPRAIEGLKLAGFDALSIANNHTMDYGKGPAEETVALLDEAGIGHAGAGPNIDAAWEPAVIDTGGLTTAYLAFTHVLPPGFLAGEDRWGVAYGRGDMARTRNAIKTAKDQYDYVIVSFHWGIEYKDDANDQQEKWAYAAIDAGADMVLAHHPHVIQGVEFYKNRLIAYSLGDFVWDHHTPKTGETFILEAELGPAGVANAMATPVYLDPSTGKPDYASERTSEVILGRLKKISEKHDTEVTIEGGMARIGR